MEKIKVQDLDKTEIFYCNLFVRHSKKTKIIEKVVFKNQDGYYRNVRELAKNGIKDPVKVIEIEVIKRLGFENKNKGFSEVKKSDEVRNKITGAYE